ncbi:MAG TPA: hypothetical protein VFT01_06635 [Homoserinimonas sp.]|nr:hypothetical protein [Homoserinimonas sp.]
MSSPQRAPLQRSPNPPVPSEAAAVTTGSYWLVPVLRAIPAVVVGLIITFTEDHGPRTGLIAFGVFAVVSGIILFAGSLRMLADRVVRGMFITQATISLIAGAAALVLWGSGIGVLLLIVTVYTALTGALELYSGLRSRGVAPARDWVSVGAYTAVAAIVFVLIPPDSILAIGLIGAYGIILGVFLMIAGLSLKWASGKPGESGPVEGKVSQ